MPSKLLYENIKIKVTELGYKLFDTEETYKNSNSFYIYCNGWNKQQHVQLYDLVKIEPGSKRCKECGIKKRSESKARNSGVYKNITEYLENLCYKLLNTKDEIIDGMKQKKNQQIN